MCNMHKISGIICPDKQAMLGERLGQYRTSNYTSYAPQAQTYKSHQGKFYIPQKTYTKQSYGGK